MPKHSHRNSRNFDEQKTSIAKAIGSRIRVRRFELGMKQETVKAKMELEGVYISRSQLSRIELGETVPSAIQIVALSTILKVSYEWLLDGNNK